LAKRFLMWLLVTFVGTMFLCTFLSLKVAFILGCVCLVAMLPVALIPFRFRPTTLGCLIAALLSVALFLLTMTPVVKTQQIVLNRECTIEGTVVELGHNSAQTLDRLSVRLTKIDGNKVSSLNPFHVYLYTDLENDCVIGSTVKGCVKFFDHSVEFGAGRENFVFASAYEGQNELLLQVPTSFNGYKTLDEFNDVIQSRVAFGKEKTVGLLQSVCFGNKSNLDPTLAVSLRRTGLSHVTAVSGLHLTFAVALFNFVFLLCGVSYRIRYLLGIFVAIIFTAFVGFPPSCVRACVMLVIFSLGMALDLFSDSLTSLSLAAFLIVLVQPLSVRDVGFQLSILATVGIIVLSGPIQKFLFPDRLKIHRRRLTGIYRNIIGIISCSIAVAITTLPISLFVFGSVSLIAPVSNALLIGPFELFFMLGILMAVLGFIPGVGPVFGFLCNVLYAVIDFVARLLGRLPFASVSKITYSGLIFIVLLGGVLGVSLYHYFCHKRRSFVALFLAFLCFCGLYSGAYGLTHRQSNLEIAFVDVGQGDCTVLTKGNRAVIFDYGGSSDKRYNLIDYFKKRGIVSVELLALTHLHDDHTNGLSTLLNNVYVDRILYPSLEFDSPEIMALITSQNGQSLLNEDPFTVLDDIKVTPFIEAAYSTELETVNERCVCYRVEYGETSLLVTGDMESRTEAALLPRMQSCTLLKVAHHGSDTSSLYPFLKRISPEIAVISVGENSYGLPDPSVIQRLKTLCTTLYVTQSDGTVLFKTDGTVLERIIE